MCGAVDCYGLSLLRWHIGVIAKSSIKSLGFVCLSLFDVLALLRMAQLVILSCHPIA